MSLGHDGTSLTLSVKAGQPYLSGVSTAGQPCLSGVSTAPRSHVFLAGHGGQVLRIALRDVHALLPQKVHHQQQPLLGLLPQSPLLSDGGPGLLQRCLRLFFLAAIPLQLQLLLLHPLEISPQARALQLGLVAPVALCLHLAYQLQ